MFVKNKTIIYSKVVKSALPKPTADNSKQRLLKITLFILTAIQFFAFQSLYTFITRLSLLLKVNLILI